jgi:hypothetical protein
MSILGQAQKHVYIGTATKTSLYWDSHKNMSILGQAQIHVYIGTGTKPCLYWDRHINMSILGQAQKHMSLWLSQYRPVFVAVPI